MSRMRLVVCVGVFVLVGLLVGGLTTAAPNETRLMRYPDISRDRVVFCYASDLWTVARAGGEARRLTAHPGDELHPKFSPDGKWVAFSGEYDGSRCVYVIPAEGGEPRRLTFHPGNDVVLGWTRGGKKILFRSNRYSAPPNFTRLFTVSPEGGMPEMLSVPRASLASFSPDGARIAFNTTSQESRTWKRYRGGWTNQIDILDLKTSAYQPLPRVNALNMFPMWHGASVYFISDREGVMNLFRYDLESKRTAKVTTYTEYDIKWPSLGPDAVVYENGGQLYEYGLQNGQTRKIPVHAATDAIAARPEIKTVDKSIRTFELSPSGVRALFEARGEIFTVPVEQGSTRNLTDTPGVHELYPRWSPDGKWISYLSDKTGEYEIYLRPQKGGDEIRVTSDGDCYRYDPVWAPDSKKVAYTDKKLRLWYVDIDEKKPVQADRSEYRGGLTPAWAPDSRWLTYTKPGANGNSSIYLYSLDQKKVFRATEGFYTDGRPAFDPTGKYLFFLSSRFFYPSSSRFDPRFNYYSTDGIFAITLKADEPSPFAPQSDDEKDADQKKADEEKDKKAEPAAKKAGEEKKGEEKAAEKKPEVKPIQVDVEGIGNRIAVLPIPAGLYGGLSARKDKLFYVSVPFEITQAGMPNPLPPSATLHLYDLKKREDKVLLTAINDYDLDKEGNKIIYRAGETYGVVDAQPGKKVGDGKLNTSNLQVQIDPREEWKQIFHEAWRIERDFYWDPAMGGLDWGAIGKRYEALLPWVAHRSDLNYIIGEMIAELATSHTYVSGGEMPDRKRVGVGMLGADFAADGGFYRIKKIYRGENWNEDFRSPLTEPGLKVKQGDYLIAVNGVAVRAPAEPYSYFQNLAGKVVTLKINDKPSEQGAWEISVKATRDEVGVRYLDWIESNRRKVAEASGGRIGYMHVPDTSINGLIMFDKYLGAQAGMDGMIIDERYNGGGMIPDFYTEKLQRRLLAVIAPREGKDQPWPSKAIYGPKVMIVNELAGSGGDCFPWFFKRLKIGPVVGTRTWGGLIGISRGVPLLDGGSVTAPEIAFWSTDNGGEWVVENYGVDPDYVVEQRPDLEIAGHDPQLEKAIELAVQGLKSYQPPPARPKYPSKVFAPSAAKPAAKPAAR